MQPVPLEEVTGVPEADQIRLGPNEFNPFTRFYYVEEVELLIHYHGYPKRG